MAEILFIIQNYEQDLEDRGICVCLCVYVRACVCNACAD
jgi:hypothetical protein